MEKRCLGWSSDGRTHRWEITCVCGKKFEPITTMLRWQSVECPKCKATEVIDYNAD